MTIKRIYSYEDEAGDTLIVERFDDDTPPGVMVSAHSKHRVVPVSLPQDEARKLAEALDPEKTATAWNTLIAELDAAEKRTEAHRVETRRLTDKIAAMQETATLPDKAPPAPDRGAEDRRKPPHGYEVTGFDEHVSGPVTRRRWLAKARMPNRPMERDEATAHCWAHHDSLTAPAEARALAAEERAAHHVGAARAAVEQAEARVRDLENMLAAERRKHEYDMREAWAAQAQALDDRDDAQREVEAAAGMEARAREAERRDEWARGMLQNWQEWAEETTRHMPEDWQGGSWSDNARRKITGAIEAARQAGREAERASVVEWLRFAEHDGQDEHADNFADDIEAGEHAVAPAPKSPPLTDAELREWGHEAAPEPPAVVHAPVVVGYRPRPKPGADGPSHAQVSPDGVDAGSSPSAPIEWVLEEGMDGGDVWTAEHGGWRLVVQGGLVEDTDPSWEWEVTREDGPASETVRGIVSLSMDEDDEGWEAAANEVVALAKSRAGVVALALVARPEATAATSPRARLR